VRTKQDLFYLPDMDRMQVHALIHESQVDDVEVGQRARIRVEALPDRELDGEVVSIDQMPFRNRDWRASPDVKYFIVKIEIQEAPRGLRPGMTAGVEILAEQRQDALVLPIEAIAHEDGSDVVYVAGPDGAIERRVITARSATLDLVCVDSGLDDGDEVVLDPGHHLDHLPSREEPVAVSQ